MKIEWKMDCGDSWKLLRWKMDCADSWKRLWEHLELNWIEFVNENLFLLSIKHSIEFYKHKNKTKTIQKTHKVTKYQKLTK